MTEEEGALRYDGLVVSHPPLKKNSYWKLTIELFDFLEKKSLEKKIEFFVSDEKYPFFPIEKGDKISCCLAPIEGGGYSLIGTPLVILFDDLPNLKDFFKAVLRTKNEDVYNLVKNYVTDLFISKEREDSFDEGKEVVDFLNWMSVNYSILKKELEIPFEEEVTPKIIKILKKWYTRRILRQLYLLGLNNLEIKKSGLDPLELYYTLISNPYQIPAVSMETARKILLAQGKETTLEMRVGGRALRRVVELCSGRGWTFVPSFILKKDVPSYDLHLDVLRDEYSLVFEGEKVYYDKFYTSEICVSDFLSELISTNEIDDTEKEKVEEYLAESNTSGKIIYTSEQLEAITLSIISNLTLIIGGAGCGKTTVIRKIISVLDAMGKRSVITSFTGKAVARICEVLCEMRASTMDYLIVKKKSCEKISVVDEWMKFEYLIIDEISMVPTELFYRFISVFTHDYKIIMIGDNNQLTPIGSGSLMEEILKLRGKCFLPIVELTLNHRIVTEKNTSELLTVSSAILESGRSGDTPSLSGGKQYFEVLTSEPPTADPIPILENFKKLGIPPTKFKVLCPYNEPLDGINEFIQALFIAKDGADFVVRNNKKWYVGDLVVMTINDNGSGLKNGSCGVVTDFNTEYISVEFDFIDFKQIIRFWYITEKEDEKLNINLLQHNYATTIHKAQGSEYQIVIVYIPKRKYSPKGRTDFLNYRMIYTAITRAKNLCWVVGDYDTYYTALTKIPPRRYEALADRISTNLGLETSASSCEEVWDEPSFKDLMDL